LCGELGYIRLVLCEEYDRLLKVHGAALGRIQALGNSIGVMKIADWREALKLARHDEEVARDAFDKHRREHNCCVALI
jgi:hypothetical protein